MATSLEISEKTLSFGEKIAKIGPADPICVREIIKKQKKKERNLRKQNI